MRLFSTLVFAVILTGCPDDGPTAEGTAPIDDATVAAPDGSPDPDQGVVETDIGPADMAPPLDAAMNDAGQDAATPTRCSAPPASPHRPTGPLPPAASAARGVDAWEWDAYARLRESVLANPEVHFLATYDAQSGEFVLDGGPAVARVQVRYIREDTPDGSAYRVTEGDLAAIFPDTEAAHFPDLEALIAAYENPNDADYTQFGYAADDPRVGFIPSAAQSYPDALIRLGSLFDAPDAPDLVYGLRPGAQPGPGTHGGLGLLQSRATLMFGGAGARADTLIDEPARLVDVLPTILAALGAETTGGVGPDGTYDEGLYLRRQDGRVLWEALAEAPCDRPDHVVLILFDGLMATEINHQIHADVPDVELPAMRAVMAGGATYRYGATVGFPSMSGAGHTTSGTGLWPGHSGVLGNSYYGRAEGTAVTPFDILTDIQRYLGDIDNFYALLNRLFAPDIENTAEAAHRGLGAWDGESGAYVAVFNELTLRGADYSTIHFLGGAPTKALSTYRIADNLALVQVESLLGDRRKPVPTILQLSFLSTDAAGESDGPHSPLLREVLLEMDERVGAIRDAYARRDALARTLFVFVADHGMELQDPSRATNVSALIAESGVQTSFVSAGLVYLRTLELETRREGGVLRVRVLNHDDAAPKEGATVHCEGCPPQCEDCGPAQATTDEDGWAELTAPADGPVLVLAELNGFNPQTLSVE